MTPNGIYVLSEDIKPLPERMINNPDLAGVSLRGRWNEFQPGKESFEWSFDNEIARAQRAGKKVFLRVDPSRMPDWMPAEGAQSFAFRVANIHGKDFGQSKNMPVPWDPVFITCWSHFIQQMGQRYAHNSTVVMIQMAGANQGGGELHLPSDPDAKMQWVEKGYTEEKLVTAYKQIIDAYDAAFPQTQLGLNISEALFQDGAAETIAQYAFHKLGRRLSIQHNALHATTKPEAFRIHKIVRSYERKATVGFQLLSPASSKKNYNGMGNGFGGELHTAFDIGLASGASYFEIYPMDLDDPPSAADIHQLSLHLAR